MIHMSLYHNTADRIRLGKGSYLKDKADFTGDFKGTVNIEKPIIGFNITGLFDYNYAYIQELNRYYFIDTFDVEREGLVTLYLSEDYLMSHKVDIGNLYVQLDRWEKAYSDGIEQNKLLIDNYLPRLNKLDYAFAWANTSGNDEDLTDLKNPSDVKSDAYFYRVLTPTQGINVSDDDYDRLVVPSVNCWGCNCMLVSRKHIDYIMYYMYSDQDFINKLFKIFSDISTTMKSIMIFPFNMPTNWRPEKYFLSKWFKVGNNEINVLDNLPPEPPNELAPDLRRFYPYQSVIQILRFTAMRVRGGSITLSFDFGESSREPMYEWAKREPYSNCKLFIPFVGLVDIDLSVYIGKTIYLDYTVDIQNGMATAYLNTAFNSDLYSFDYQRTAFASYKCQMGAEVPFSSADFSNTLVELGTRMFSNALNLLPVASAGRYEQSVAQSRAETPEENTDADIMFYKNRAYGLNGVSRALRDIHSAHASSCMSAEPSSSWNSIVGQLSMYAICSYTKFYEPTRYKYYTGYPAMDTNFIKNFSGYLRISGTYAEQYLATGGLPNATENERNVIINMLRNGIIA